MTNYQLTTIWGIPIRINVSLLLFLPFLAWLIGSGQQIDVYAGLIAALTGTSLPVETLQVGATPWLIGVTAAVGLFASVAVHELGHSWTAMRYGIEVESITLWILGGLANMKEIPKEWNRELWIALAGPATSILVAVVCLVGVGFVPASLPAAIFVVGWLGVTNFVLAIFNLLPAFPMDGGRVLRALLARWQSYPKATQNAARVGRLFGIGFAIVGIIAFAPLLLLLAWFVYSAASSESKVVLLESMLEGTTVRDIWSPDTRSIDPDATIAQCVDQMLATRQTVFPVVENDVVVGAVGLADLKRVKPQDRQAMLVRDVMETTLPELDSETTGFEALMQLSQSQAIAGYVLDRGERVGVVSQADFASLFDLKRQIGL